MRHLHDKVKTVDERTAPPTEDSAAAEAAAAAAMGGMGMMGMMGADTLMITNGGGMYGVPGMPMPGMGYGAPMGMGGIPDPYAQPQYGYGANPGYY